MTSEFDLDLQKLHLAQARSQLPGPGYYSVLAWVHRILRPKIYIEIGVYEGHSLRIAPPDTACIGVDPAADLNGWHPHNLRMFAMTSDEFFQEHDLTRVMGAPHFDLAFIDGLHLFEQVLKDFIHLERFSSPQSVIVLHDCLPLDKVTSARRRTTAFYSGDVWKLVLCLKQHRPDLDIAIIPTFPTGLCLITGLSLHSVLLEKNYDSLVSQYIDMTFEDYRNHSDQIRERIGSTKEAVTMYLSRRKYHVQKQC